MKFQESIEGSLDGGTIISVKDRDKSENAYSEVGDLVDDRPLLRYLLYCEGRIQRNKPVLAHLIVGNSLLKSFDESHNFSRILPLVYELSCCTFRQQFPRLLLNSSQRAARVLTGEGGVSS